MNADFSESEPLPLLVLGAVGGLIVIEQPNSPNPDRWLFPTLDAAIKHIDGEMRRNFAFEQSTPDRRSDD